MFSQYIKYLNKMELLRTDVFSFTVAYIAAAAAAGHEGAPPVFVWAEAAAEDAEFCLLCLSSGELEVCTEDEEEDISLVWKNKFRTVLNSTKAFNTV